MSLSNILLFKLTCNILKIRNSVFLISILLLFFSCDPSANIELPSYLPTEIEIKSKLSDNEVLAKLQTKARSLGYNDLKEWKNSIADRISDSEIDAMQKLSKSQGEFLLSQDSNIIEYRNELKNRLAWYNLFRSEGVIILGSSKHSKKAESILSKFTQLPSRGNPNAKLIIFEFSDYTCPYCRKSHAVSREIFEKYKDKIRWIFIDFPLTDPPFLDSPAHLLGSCILSKDRNQFWKYYDIAFTRQGMGSIQNVSQIAMNDFGFTENSWSDCENGIGSYKSAQIELIHKKQFLSKFGVNATPSFLIGEQLVQGYLPFEKFQKILETELK